MINRLRNFINRVTSPKREPGVRHWWWPTKNGAGVIINHQNALQLSACVACVKCRAEDIGKMPWRVFREVGGRQTLRAD